ncbi:MAG: murein biosynthesis integral membrane protein MurJ [Alphaproteobacteria bacterium]|nr:murein biosynthesis integral membrane protein MurJ [Alphaproteobacteria bacterium]
MSLLKSITTFGGWTLVSRVTGFLRDVVLANYLGAGMVSDAFFVSFKLPNLFRSLFAEGAFSAAFVPIFSQKLVGEGKQQAVKFAAQAISVLALLVGLFVLVMEVVMPAVVMVLAPGFADDAGKIELATFLSRITFPFLLLVSIVSFQSGILNSLGKFAAPASTPVILNLTMISSVFVLMPIFSTPAYRIAIGIPVAGVLEVLWLRYFLKRQGVEICPQKDVLNLLKTPEIKTLFKRIAPGVFGAGIYQINMMVDTILVSLVGTGAISWLYYANRLQQLPLGVVGAAIGVALLPILSKQVKSEDTIAAKRTQDKAIEYGALMSMPAAVALIVLALPTVNILFQHGKFGALQTLMTSKAVIAYAVGLPMYVMVKAMTPNFFARGDTKTPVKYSVVVLFANLIFSVILMKPFGHVGIASATTLAAFVSLYQYVHGLKKRGFWSFSAELKIRMVKIAFCSLLMGGVLHTERVFLSYCIPDWLGLSVFIKLFLLGVIGAIAVLVFLIAIKLCGIVDVFTFAKNMIKRRRKQK